MNVMEKLRDIMCRELEESATVRSGHLNPGELDAIHRVIDTIKNLDKIQMLEETGYSFDAETDMEMGKSNLTRKTGYSNRKRRGLYSSTAAKDSMMEHVDEMMAEAEDEKTREMIRRFKQDIERA